MIGCDQLGLRNLVAQQFKLCLRRAQRRPCPGDVFGARARLDQIQCGTRLGDTCRRRVSLRLCLFQTLLTCRAAAR